jgi:chromate reductase
VRASDAVLFATPEYNRSIPGVLKNAIDVGSRPAGASVWGGKPAAVMSVSPGSLGGFGANHHLRQSLVFLDMPVLQQPEAYLGRAASFIDARGQITSSETLEFLKIFVSAFDKWVRRLRAAEIDR